jgi:hypothetical protein
MFHQGHGDKKGNEEARSNVKASRRNETIISRWIEGWPEWSDVCWAFHGLGSFLTVDQLLY